MTPHPDPPPSRGRETLVTGASGFLGTRTVELLAASGRRVLALTSPRRPRGRWETTPAGVEVVSLDLKDRAALEEIVRSRDIREAAHLAAAGVLAEASWEELFSTNVLALVTLAQALSKKPDHFLVAAGSMSEYGKSVSPLLTTSTPLRPVTAYGVSKAAAALALGSLEAERGLGFALLRLFHVYGPGEAAQRLFPYVISQLLQGKPAETTSLEQVRDLVFSDDAARAVVSALERRPRGAILNVATERATSLRECVTWIADRLGKPELLRVGARPHRPGEVMRLVGGPLSARDVLDWKPRPWEEGLALMIDAARTSAAAAP